MKFRKRVTVDSGQIVALVVDSPTKKSVPISKGKYEISLSVKTSWNDGLTTSVDFLDVKKDSYLAFADGFWIGDDESRFYKSSNIHPRGCIIDTGGDGLFVVTVTLKKIRLIPFNPHKRRVQQAKAFLKRKGYSEENAKEYIEIFGYFDDKVRDLLEEARHKNLQKTLDKIKKILDKHES